MNDCPNASSENGFYIVAFSMSSVEQLELFLVILVIYLMAVLGNLTIIFLVCFVPKLHTPMYFFLCNLAALDVMSTTTSIPKMLAITITQDHKISFLCCMTQMFFFILCTNGEICMLTSMAYDRYVAICKPLQYYTIMRRDICIIMAAFSWIVATINSIVHTILTFILQFCDSSEINNFFCDLNTLIALSSTDITSRKVFMVCEAAIFSVAEFMLIIISYIFIFSTILKIQSSTGRMKAFSSCTSHLITVILFYGPIIIMYMKPESDESKDRDKLLSIIYLVVVPLLNPLVYSLRNKDVWEAIVSLIK